MSDPGINARALEGGVALRTGAGALRSCGGTWAQAHYVKAPLAKDDLNFGSGTAIFGGGIVIGAAGDGSSSPDDQTDTSTPHAGAAYFIE